MATALTMSPPAEMFFLIASGLSQEAKAVERAVSERSQSASLTQSRIPDCSEPLLEELAELFADCCEENWDGYGATALSSKACNRTLSLLKALPIGMPHPELSAMPNGDVALDWDFAPRKTITVTVAGGSLRLAYAAINGDEEWSGTVSFVSVFPLSIKSAITQIIER